MVLEQQTFMQIMIDKEKAILRQSPEVLKPVSRQVQKQIDTGMKVSKSVVAKKPNRMASAARKKASFSPLNTESTP